MTAAAHVERLRALYGTPAQRPTPTPTERLDSLQRGLQAAADGLAALRRHRHRLGAEGLAHQLAGLHREAQHLAAELVEDRADAS